MKRLYLLCLLFACNREQEPYGPCDAIGRDCDDGGLCIKDLNGSVCLPPCERVEDCPAAGSADVRCSSNCFPYCKTAGECPAGMTCSVVEPETVGLCEVPE